MKKIILMIAAFLLMTGCGGKMIETENELSDEEYERLIQLDGPMFCFSHSSNGLVCADDDYWSGDTYTVYYDGTIEKCIKYSISGEFTSQEALNKDEYITIYEFCRNWMQSDMNGAYDYGGCEQDSYSFDFYDEEGEQHNLYYTDNPSGDPLKEVIKICGKYNRGIKVELFFDISKYVDPSCQVLFAISLSDADVCGFGCECTYSGNLYIGNDYNKNLSWLVYIFPEEPDEWEYYPGIDTIKPDLVNEGVIEVKQGEWICIQPSYLPDKIESPDNVHLWGFYDMYDDPKPYRTED
jgi:hypothetical protein